MNTMNRNEPLVARLVRWKDDRGALANLRCGLRSQSALRRRAWPLLAQLTNRDSPMLVIFETVAGLWAADPDSHRAGSGNFGVTCRQLRGDHESFDLRFRRLLACDDREELCERLVPVALAAQAKGIVMHCDNLFSDLQYFAGAGRDRVRTRWAQAYWGTSEVEAQPESQTANTTAA
jgi:CRISPR type I-E-associated protein CasB/Cse2